MAGTAYLYAGQRLQQPEEDWKSRSSRASFDSSRKRRAIFRSIATERISTKRFVRPTFVDLQKVGAHYAISSCFNPYPDEPRIYCYTARLTIFAQRTPAGSGW